MVRAMQKGKKATIKQARILDKQASKKEKEKA